MSKFMPLLLLAVMAATQKALHMVDLAESRYSSTPSMPHIGHHGRVRLHAPNDGHWHMKFHRSIAR